MNDDHWLLELVAFAALTAVIVIIILVLAHAA